MGCVCVYKHLTQEVFETNSTTTTTTVPTQVSSFHHGRVSEDLLLLVSFSLGSPTQLLFSFSFFTRLCRPSSRSSRARPLNITTCGFRAHAAARCDNAAVGARALITACVKIQQQNTL